VAHRYITLRYVGKWRWTKTRKGKGRKTSAKKGGSYALRSHRSGGTAAPEGISQPAKPFVSGKKWSAVPTLKVLDDLPAFLPILEAEAALLEANCHDLLAAILDASDDR
jgi:hypothetical protein